MVPPATTYSWSAPSVSGGITGGAAGTNQTSVSGTLNNPTNTVQTATYTVTPAVGSCPGTPFTLTMTVNPRPVIATKLQVLVGEFPLPFTPVNGTDIVPARNYLQLAGSILSSPGLRWNSRQQCIKY